MTAMAPFHRICATCAQSAGRWRLAALGGAALALLHGCGDAGSQPGGGMPPPEVTVVTVKPRTLPLTFEYTAQAAGFREVEVRSRVSGILLKRNFEEGARVSQGQSLYSIDPVPFQSALARAEADLAGAQARLAQARRNVARLAPLMADRAASQKEFDDARSAEQIAEADLAGAQARLFDAKLNLEYTRVESPIAGIAGRSEQPEGTLVSGPAVRLTVVTQVDPIYVNFGIPESEHLALRRDSEQRRVVLPADGRFDVKVRLADGRVHAAPGKLGFADVRIDPATGTSGARAQFPNPAGSIRPGQFLRVMLSGAFRPNAILVPQRAVLDGPKGKFVYVVGGGDRAEPRPVEVGEWVKEEWLILSGLAPGDRVIADGVMKIGPGAPVRIAQPGQAAPGGPPGSPGGAPPGGPAKGAAAPEPPAKGATAPQPPPKGAPSPARPAAKG